MRLWDVATGMEVRRIAGVGAMVWSPDGKVLASSCEKTIHLWDIETGKELFRFEGHTGAISAVAFSPNGQMLASVAYDQTVRVWRMPK